MKKCICIVTAVIIFTVVVITMAFRAFEIERRNLELRLKDTETALENVGAQNIKLQEEIDWYRQMHDDSKVPLTEEERCLLEETVYAEIGSGSLTEQMAVAQVIHDRMVLWGKTAPQVISGSQFADPKGDPPEQVRQAVSMVFDYGCFVFDEPVTHFYAYNNIAEPYWASNKIVRGKDRFHVFMY